MAKTNVEHLSKLLTTDEQQEFLDAILTDHHKECREKEESIDLLKDEISELQNQDTFDGIVINTGIGIIKYEIDGSLDLVQLMEALAAAIEQQGATAVLRKLEETYAV